MPTVPTLPSLVASHATPISQPSTQSLPPHTHSLASVTGEAVRVVRLSECCHHPPLHILSTREALGSKQDVIVLAAVVVVILHKVATRGQQLPALWGEGGRGG